MWSAAGIRFDLGAHPKWQREEASLSVRAARSTAWSGKESNTTREQAGCAATLSGGGKGAKSTVRGRFAPLLCHCCLLLWLHVRQPHASRALHRAR